MPTPTRTARSPARGTPCRNPRQTPGRTRRSSPPPRLSGHRTTPGHPPPLAVAIQRIHALDVLGHRTRLEVECMYDVTHPRRETVCEFQFRHHAAYLRGVKL